METGLLAGRVPYIRGGSGPREAVVFFGVNALLRRLDRSSSPNRYACQAARLLPGHRFTILGYAGSSFDEIVRDMALVTPAPLDLVLGISFGGFVAMRFAAVYPMLVRRLVLLVSAHRFSTEGSQRIKSQFRALERGDIPTLVRENALLFRRPWYNWLIRLKLWKEGSRIGREFRPPAAILQDYRELFGPEFRNNAEYCKRITSPTLVIGGTADQLFDRAALEETAALIPGARIELFEEETHMLPIERNRELGWVITEFLESNVTR